MKTYIIMKKYIKYICAILLVIGTSARAWSAETSVALFNSATVVTSDGYGSAYGGTDWYLSSGGGNDKAGFNASHVITIGENFGTSANTTHDGFYIKTKNKLNDVCKITFTYSFCSVAAQCAAAKIYLGYSTDGSSWSAVPLTSGTQGASIAPDDWDGSAGTSNNYTTWTFEFSKIASAYYAVIISRNGKVASEKGFTFTNTQVDFRKGCCDQIVTPAKGTRTNCEIAFAPEEVATCSSTAADRQLKVTLTQSL